MVFRKSKKSDSDGHSNLGYVDDDIKHSKLNSEKIGVESKVKDDKKEDTEEEKDKSSFFALVSFPIKLLIKLGLVYCI